MLAGILRKFTAGLTLAIAAAAMLLAALGSEVMANRACADDCHSRTSKAAADYRRTNGRDLTPAQKENYLNDCLTKSCGFPVQRKGVLGVPVPGSK